jgi:short-subunit dehydrogenase
MVQHHGRSHATPRQWFTNGDYIAPSVLPGREDRDSGTHLKFIRRMTMPLKLFKPSVLITGASTGIGAVYADRFAARGHDLVLVARDRARMEDLADRLRREKGAEVDILRADLTDVRDLVRVEARLRDDHRIGVLVNNAGTAPAGGFVDQNPEEVARIVSLNAMAPMRLASAVAPRFAQAGRGAIVNIGSVIGLAPEYGATVYGATKAFILFLSQSLHGELGPKGVYVQAVLPAAVRTEIWEHAGKDVDKLPAVMEVDELVDAALAGFDRRETVTIPPLPDAAQWTDFEAARKVMFPNTRQAHAAARYRHLAA